MIPQHLLIPLGVITAALIAGLFSYLALIISKENKVSELRQAWIDELRKELAEFLAAARLINFKLQILKRKHGSTIPPTEVDAAISEPYETGLIALNKVLLRLNPEGTKNEKSAALISELKVVQDFFKENKFSEASEHLRTVRDVGQILLRSEWSRVKEGEPVYFWSKRAFAAILTLSFLTIAGFSIRIAFSKQEPIQPAGAAALGLSKGADKTIQAPTKGVESPTATQPRQP